MTDKRRCDLIIPYQPPALKDNLSDITGTLGSTLPMAAMFTRNKFVGWASFIFAIQNWLGESKASRKSTSQPAFFTVGMSFVALIMTYLPIFLSPTSGSGKSARSEANIATVTTT